MDKKLIIVSAPSGTGKSTIIQWLMSEHPELRLSFSISCTSREPRGQERNGVEYYFLSADEFRRRIDSGDFLEYVEVYPGRFYGTLKSQVEQQSAEGQTVVFDVDVLGGLRIKEHYGDRALSIFIQPPSVEELRRRLTARGTDAPDVIEQRIARAEMEMSYAAQFDCCVVNDRLEQAEAETYRLISEFLGTGR
ncbi:MAG: guanylate kinase [Prevotella sp.]|nr:guanylate kinase [Prevotella sp.]